MAFPKKELCVCVCVCVFVYYFKIIMQPPDQ